MAQNFHGLAVRDFKSQSDDFSVWVKMFEDSVKLANKDANEAEREDLCIQWLPFKLDEESRVIHGNVTKTAWKVGMCRAWVLSTVSTRYRAYRTALRFGSTRRRASEPVASLCAQFHKG